MPFELTDMSDMELVEKYRSTQQLGFLTELWLRHRKILFNSIFKRTRYIVEDTEDLVQETFFKIKEAIENGQCRSDKNIRGWIIAVGCNLTMDFHRNKPKKPSTPNYTDHEKTEILWNSLSNNSTPETILIDKEEYVDVIESIYQALPALPEKYVTLIKLRFYDGMSFKEMSKILDRPENTVRTQTFRAITKLKAELSNIIDLEGLKRFSSGRSRKKSDLLSYSEARKAVQQLNIKTSKAFFKYLKTNNLPEGIPKAPHQKYLREGTWGGWKDFLGTKTTNN